MKHIGKDFAYTIEENHGLGVDPSKIVQQPMPLLPVMPEIPSITSDSTGPVGVDSPQVSPQDERVDEKIVDEQAMADQTVQIIPDLNSAVPAEAQLNTFAPVEPQLNNMPSMGLKMDVMFEPRLKPGEEDKKTTGPLETQGKFVLFDPHVKTMMEKFGIQPIPNQGHEQVKVVPHNYRMTHHGFRFYQPVGYYYPFGMVRLV